MRKLRNLKWKILALLARWGILLPGKIMYIGGSDTLPPPLKREEEAALIVRMGEGDEKAKNILIEHNLRLVVYIAKRFENTGINIEDLISIGTIGLIKGISSYKPEKKVRLATYAARCIENEVLMFFRSQKKLQGEVSLSETLETDKDGNIIYLYATDMQAQYSYAEAARAKGYNVLLMDGQLDPHFISLLEQKQDKTRLVRVDADIVDRLIVKTDKKDAGLTPLQVDVMSTLFRSQIPALDKAEFVVEFESLSPTDVPATVTQNEFMRRMKDMSAMQPGMNFYGQLPDSY